MGVIVHYIPIVYSMCYSVYYNIKYIIIGTYMYYRYAYDQHVKM